VPGGGVWSVGAIVDGVAGGVRGGGSIYGVWGFFSKGRYSYQKGGREGEESEEGRGKRKKTIWVRRAVLKGASEVLAKKGLVCRRELV